MSAKREQIISLKLALVALIVMALFWFVWSLFGDVPEKSTVTSVFFKEPRSIELSRWWDVVCAPLLVYLFSLVAYFLLKVADTLSEDAADEDRLIVGLFFGAVVFIWMPVLDQILPLVIISLVLFIAALIHPPMVIYTALPMIGLPTLSVSLILGWVSGLVFYVISFLSCAVVAGFAVLLRNGCSKLARWVASDNVT